MSGRIVKVVSVLLCAVLVVGCCFVGCESAPSLTREELLEIIQDDFPEAHIGTSPYSENSEILFFFEDESSSECMTIPQNPEKDIDRFSIDRLSSMKNTIKILNSVMPNFIPEWTVNDTDSFIELAEPNETFTEWNNEPALYKIGEHHVFVANGGDEGMRVNIVN